jgi:undecaprenyl-diphosphatase
MPNVYVTIIASILIWVMFFTLILLALLPGKITLKHVFEAIFVSFIAWMVAETIKYLYPVNRPYIASGLTPLTLTMPNDPSFPSTHASTSFALAISVRKHDRNLGVLYIIFAILVSLGRVLGNVHYYIDVVAGGLIGVLTVLIIEKTRIFKRFAI